MTAALREGALYQSIITPARAEQRGGAHYEEVITVRTCQRTLEHNRARSSPHRANKGAAHKITPLAVAPALTSRQISPPQPLLGETYPQGLYHHAPWHGSMINISMLCLSALFLCNRAQRHFVAIMTFMPPRISALLTLAPLTTLG